MADTSFLSAQLQREKVEFWWGPEGLWLPGRELENTFVISAVVVSFSAAFIFPSNLKSCPKPNLNLTTDRGAFTVDQVRVACDEVKRLGALAYVADGAGLEIVAPDEQLIKQIEVFAGTKH